MGRVTPTAVNSARTLVVWVIRAAAVGLLAVGSYLFLKRLFFAIGGGPGGFERMFQVWEGTGEGQSTYRGLAMVVVGGAMAVGARRVARWVIAMPEGGCPACGYAGSVSDTCPECGLRGVESGPTEAG